MPTMTNDAAIELCKRSKSVCLLALQDARSAAMHWCHNDEELRLHFDALERHIKSYLDQKAREVFEANLKPPIELPDEAVT